MPEGDTIHRAAANLARALTGRTVTRFQTGYAQLARVDDQAAIAGRSVEAVWAEGKHLLMRFSGGLTLRTHMRMSGSWHIYRPGQRWQRPHAEMRVLIETDAYHAVAFLVPVAEFLDDRALGRAPSLRRLGPDVLAPDFDPAEARRRLRERPDQPMSEVPLDQGVAAGPGNIYRCEGLFVAKINPFALASAVADADIERLYAGIAKLMRAAKAAGSDRRWVYGRAGKPCRRCGTPIAYRKVGPEARGLHFCPVCQQ